MRPRYFLLFPLAGELCGGLALHVLQCLARVHFDWAFAERASIDWCDFFVQLPLQNPLYLFYVLWSCGFFSPLLVDISDCTCCRLVSLYLRIGFSERPLSGPLILPPMPEGYCLWLPQCFVTFSCLSLSPVADGCLSLEVLWWTSFFAGPP